MSERPDHFAQMRAEPVPESKTATEAPRVGLDLVDYLQLRWTKRALDFVVDATLTPEGVSLRQRDLIGEAHLIAHLRQLAQEQSKA